MGARAQFAYEDIRLHVMLQCLTFNHRCHGHAGSVVSRAAMCGKPWPYFEKCKLHIQTRLSGPQSSRWYPACTSLSMLGLSVQKFKKSHRTSDIGGIAGDECSTGAELQMQERPVSQTYKRSALTASKKRPAFYPRERDKLPSSTALCCVGQHMWHMLLQHPALV